MNENVAIVHEIFTNAGPILFGITIVICATWAAIAVIRSLKQRADTRTRVELYRQMMDKFGSATEFVAFLQSDTGKIFIQENVSEIASPFGRVLGSAQIGVITAVLGLGLIFLGNETWLGGDINLITYILGTVSLTIGIGFLVSALVAYKLSSSWGLLKPKTKTEAETEVEAA